MISINYSTFEIVETNNYRFKTPWKLSDTSALIFAEQIKFMHNPVFDAFLIACKFELPRWARKGWDTKIDTDLRRKPLFALSLFLGWYHASELRAVSMPSDSQLEAPRNPPLLSTYIQPLSMQAYNVFVCVRPIAIIQWTLCYCTSSPDRSASKHNGNASWNFAIEQLGIVREISKGNWQHFEIALANHTYNGI